MIASNLEVTISRVKFNLNPGPFNVKEHVIIAAMAYASSSGSAVSCRHCRQS